MVFQRIVSRLPLSGRRCQKRKGCVPNASILRIEPLESRLLLASDLRIDLVEPTGAASTPFETVEVQFSEAIDEGTFTLDDVSITGSGTPSVDSITSLGANRYQLSLSGTGLDTYSLTIGPEILDSLGQAMNQDGDAAGGEVTEDAYAVTLSATALTISDGDASYDEQDLMLYGNAVTIEGIHTFENVSLWDGATLAANGSEFNASDLTIDGGSTFELAGGSVLNATGTITVSGSSTLLGQGSHVDGTVDDEWVGEGVTIHAVDITVEAGSTITADAQGYLGGSNSAGVGPGAADGGNAGATYAGVGGDGNWGDPNTTTYGDEFEPTDLGSGGGGYDGLGSGTGGSGGGALRLDVTGTLTLDGEITADGESVSTGRGEGGGSGGSLYVTTSVLAGSGAFSADGGSSLTSRGGGGGGGRVVIYYDDGDGFSGYSTSTASGGAGLADGGDGSVAFLDTSSGYPSLVVNRNMVLSADETYRFADITVRNGAILTIGGGTTVTAAGTIHLLENSQIVVEALYTGAQVDDEWVGEGVTIHAENVIVEAGSVITADAQGYLGGSNSAGVGPGSSDGGNAGATYAGTGGDGQWGDPNTDSYGDALAPTDLGSGGSGYDGLGGGTGGAGGGALQLDVSGTLTLDGEITADGESVGTGRGEGGGSGGSLYVVAETLTGSGTFSADGGSSLTNRGGGGGGGRVVVYYLDGDAYSGYVTSTADGGSGVNAGSDGSVGFFQVSDLENHLTDTERDLYVYQTYRYDTEDSTLTLNRVTVGDATASEALLAIGGGVTLEVADTIHVTNNSTLLAQATDTTAAVDGEWVGEGVRIIATIVTIDAGSALSATGEGYAATLGPAPGGSASYGSAGGAHAGAGGHGAAGAGAQTATYGSAACPTTLGSGGGNSAEGGDGGGAIWLEVSDTLSVNGSLSVDGETATGRGGGAAGGSLFISADTITGSGTISADGGDFGTVYGGGGGAGHIVLNVGDLSGTLVITADGGLASGGGGGGGGGGSVYVYTWGTMTVPEANVTATGGAGDQATGDDGEVLLTSDTAFQWLDDSGDLFHDSETLGWLGVGFDPSTTAVTLLAASDTHSYTIATGLPCADSYVWDTTAVSDGLYDIRAVFRDDGTVIEQLTREVLVNNTAQWHTESVSADETWTADTVHVVEGELSIAAGVTVALEAGAVVKFASGASIVVEDGATLDASAATETGAIVFTALADDSAGGDTNLDGCDSVALPGSWGGVTPIGAGQFLTSFHTDLRYAVAEHSGALSGDETWLGTFLHRIVGNVTVPAGVTLTIEAGAIVKFDDKLELIVQGTLDAQGTVAEPVSFTSIYDDSIAGDSNGDGDATSASAGDWRWILLEGGTATLDHVAVLYGGGTTSGSWDATGALRAAGGASLTLTNSTIRDAYFDGVLNWGGEATIKNTVITGADRAIAAHVDSTVTVTNCTLDDNRIGLLAHGGSMSVSNTIVAGSLEDGILHDMGNAPNITYSNVWSSVDGAVNYEGMDDPTGTDGNLSVDPEFKDASLGNYRLAYGSPMIDAADGGSATTTDKMGTPRYDDPRTTNTGVAMTDGSVPDMGAFEFVESADSDVDLVVSSVSGDVDIVSGTSATLTWTVTNVGAETVSGSWHDAISLVGDVVTGDSNELVVDEVVSSAQLGPGQSAVFTASVTVPAGTEGNYRWTVHTNSGGEVFEGENSGNNVAAGTISTSLSVPSLSLGETVTGTFSEVGDAVCYKIEPGEDKDVLLSLDRDDASGWTRIYVGEGYMPDTQTCSYQSDQWNEPDATVALDTTSGATYYVLVVAKSLPSGAADFSLTSEEVVFNLTGLDLNEGGNTGRVTVAITGTGLRSDVEVSLVDSADATHAAAETCFINSTLVYATFDLTDLSLGASDIVVSKDGIERSLADSFEIVAGTEATFTTTVLMPEMVRIGREFTVWIEYVNDGNTDLYAPLLHVSGNNDLGLRLEEYTDYVTSGVDLLAISMDGPAGVLRPGESGRVAVYCLAQEGTNTVNVGYVLETNEDAVDWDLLKDAVRPSYACEYWDQMWEEQIVTYGDTMGDYVHLLADAANLYWIRKGERTYREGLNLSHLTQDNMNTWFATISGHVYLDDALTPLGGVDVVAHDAVADTSYTGKSTADGLVRLLNVPDGTYELSFVGYLAPTDLETVTITDGQVVSDLAWILTAGGTIVGRVDAPEGTDFSTATLVAFDMDGISYQATLSEDGRFEVTGLPDGTYELFFSADDLTAAIQTDLIVSDAATIHAADLVVVEAGSVSGYVTDAATSLPVAGVVVGNGDESNPRATVTDEDGYYLLTGLAPGTNTIYAYSETLRTDPITGVEVAAGETTENIDLVMQAGAVLEGTVTVSGSGDPVVEAVVWVATDDGSTVDVVLTDESGQFSLSNLPSGTFTVSVDHYLYDVSEQSVTLSAGDTETITATLDSSTRIYGTVTRADGSAVSGLTVFLYSITGAYTMLTGDDGTFDFTRLEEGTYGLALEDGANRQLFEISADSPLFQYDITLNAGSIEGQVVATDGSTAVAGATVELYSDGQCVLSTWTGEDGVFSLGLVTPGTYDIMVTHDDLFFDVVEDVTVSANSTTDAGVVTAGEASLTLTLVDLATSEAPTTPGQAALVLVRSGVDEVTTGYVDVADDGTVEFTGLVAGTYRIEAVGSGLAYTPADVGIVAGSQSATLNLYEGATLSGTVETAGGEGVENITLLIVDPATGAILGRTSSDADGAYSMTNLPTGTHDLLVLDQRARTSGVYALQAISGLVFVSGGSVSQNVVVAAADIEVSGTLYNPTQANSVPMEGTIEVYDSDGNLVQTTTANAIGEFTVRGLAAGDYTLVAKACGYGSAEVAITVAGGETLDNQNVALSWKGVAAASAVEASASQLPTAASLGVPSWSNIENALRSVWNDLLEAGDMIVDGNFSRESIYNAIVELVQKLHQRPEEADKLDHFSSTCPEAMRWYQYALTKQRASRGKFDTWLQRWEGAWIENYANLGMFGINLLKTCGSMIKAQNKALIDAFQNGVSGVFKGIGEYRKTIEYGSEAYKRSEIAAQVLSQIKEEYDFLLGVTDIANGASTGMSIPDFMTKIQSAPSWKTKDWLEFSSNVYGMLGTIKSIADHVSQAGELLEKYMPSLKNWFEAIEPAVDILNTVLEALNATMRYYENVAELARLEAEYNSLIQERDAAYEMAKKVDALCPDDEDSDGDGDPTNDDDNHNGIPDIDEIPKPPEFHWPTGGHGSGNGGGSEDPNDKATIGYGADGWIAEGTAIEYTIRFENMETAELAAQEVVVTDTLDANLDWSTFELAQIGFNNVVIDVPAGLQEYTTQVEVSTDSNPVEVTVSFDADTGVITWRMQSIDPVTGELPEDPLAGFLPPNDENSSGEGFLTFAVSADAGLAAGTTIANQASIVFDVNDPIETNEVLNTIDAGAPASQVAALPTEGLASSVLVSWSGVDEEGNGSGIAGYDIYVSKDGAAYTRWLTNTQETSAVYRGSGISTYQFYSVAIDNVGNREAAPATADAEATFLEQWFTGTEGDDTFEFIAGATNDTWVVRINDVVQTVDSRAIGVYFDGLDGNDTATLTGTEGVDTADLSPTEARMVGDTYTVTAVQIETSYVDGVAGKDVASLVDSSGDDTAVFNVGETTLSGTGFEQTVANFPTVHAYARNGGTDTASFYDSARDDTFKADPAVSKLYGSGFYHRVKFFDVVHAYAKAGGDDTARFFDSEGRDTFISYPEFQKMYSGDDYYCRAKFFDTIVAYSTEGGSDVARLYDSAGDDRLIMTPEKARLYDTDETYDVTARWFETVVAYGTDGNDTARLFGKAGEQDVYRGRSHKSVFYGTDYEYTIRRFDTVTVNANGGDGDVAKLHDTSGDDHLAASGTTATLSRTNGTRTLYEVVDFPTVRAYSTTGNDTTEIEAAVDFLMLEGAWQ